MGWRLVLTGALAIASLFASKTARADDCLPTEQVTTTTTSQLALRAQADFARKRFEDAAIGFRELALHRTAEEESPGAARSYLESLNELGVAGRKACWTKITTDVPRLWTIHCESLENRTKNPDVCGTIDLVSADSERLEAQSAVDAAERAAMKTSRAAASELYEAAAKKYLTMFDRRCQDPAANGMPVRAPRCDELAYNAGRAFSASGRIAKAISMYRKLLVFDERTRMKSPIAERAAYDTAEAYEAIGMFDIAAEWFEKYTRSHPKAPRADAALAHAAMLRLGLGQGEEAVNDARNYAKVYGAQHSSETAELALAVALHHLQNDRRDAARILLSQTMGAVHRAPPDVQARALALLGRAATPSSPTLAKQVNEKVRDLFSNADAMRDRILAAHAGKEAAERQRRLREAQEAYAEALLGLADEKRRTEVLPLQGKATRERKRSAIAETESAYAEILSLDPLPPAASVAAAGRIAFMWADFASEGGGGKDDRVKPAMKRCIDLAKKLAHGGDDLRACEAWLAKTYPSEARVLDEIVLLRFETEIASPPLRAAE